jgi:hypothetical protein
MGEMSQHGHEREQPQTQGEAQEGCQGRCPEGGNEKRDNPDRARVLGSSGQQSAVNGHEPNSVPEGDCSWVHREPESDNDSRKRNFGKILGQLRELQQSHLAYVQAHEDRLRTRLKVAEEHHGQVTQQMAKLESEILKLLDNL